MCLCNLSLYLEVQVSLPMHAVPLRFSPFTMLSHPYLLNQEHRGLQEESQWLHITQCVRLCQGNALHL